MYYISVQVLPNIKVLAEKLFNISKLNISPDDDKLKSWSKTINKEKFADSGRCQWKMGQHGGTRRKILLQ